MADEPDERAGTDGSDPDERRTDEPTGGDRSDAGREAPEGAADDATSIPVERADAADDGSETEPPEREGESGSASTREADADGDTGGDGDDLADRVDALEAAVAEVRDDVAALSADEGGANGADLASVEQRLDAHEERLESVRGTVDDLESRLADHRRRSEREREEIRQFAVEDFADAMLQVKDSLDTALEVEDFEPDTAKRLDIVSREFQQALSRANVEPIDDPDAEFDSLRHKVVGKTDAPGHDPNEIVEIREPGYEIADRVLRPARVVVSM
ncbi:MAG: nucleotide exchange factor GrpE [Halobacteriaceae archaeon]